MATRHGRRSAEKQNICPLGLFVPYLTIVVEACHSTLLQQPQILVIQRCSVTQERAQGSWGETETSWEGGCWQVLLC